MVLWLSSRRRSPASPIRLAVDAQRETRVPEPTEPHLDALPAARQGRVRRPGETTIPDSVQRATEALLAEVAPEKLTVSRILERAGVSRTSFYYYFPSKDALLASLLERIADELPLPPRCGAGAAHSTAIGATLEIAFGVWERHAAILRAAQEAPREGSQLGALWHELVEERWVRPLAERLRREQGAERQPPASDLLALARALCWMSERALFDHVAVVPPPEDPGRRAAIDALALIWRRSLEQR
jgi:AcrR family transcriptional regulator